MDGYDYSKNGIYFVTIDVQDKLKLFCDIVGADPCVRPNAIGNAIGEWWVRIPTKFEKVCLDEFIIMPNHFHGIIIINNELEKNEGRTQEGQRDRIEGRTHGSARTKGKSAALGVIIQWFKTMTTNAYIHGVRENNWPKFNQRLWQRDYFERIIRDEKELFNVRNYIKNNPGKWVEKQLNCPKGVEG